jgi:hypothetical protein
MGLLSPSQSEISNLTGRAMTMIGTTKYIRKGGRRKYLEFDGKKNPSWRF